MTISHSIAAALCVLGSLTGAAHGSNINGEASFISFKVPAALDTYPMAVNSSMTVTGYYLVTNNEAHGFIRTADGTIDTFRVAGAVWTQPESINAAGDITGFYESTTEAPGKQTQGFLRYGDGRIITFDPPPQAGNAPAGFPIASMTLTLLWELCSTPIRLLMGSPAHARACSAHRSRLAMQPWRQPSIRAGPWLAMQALSHL